jgi:hypothetical protein
MSKLEKSKVCLLVPETLAGLKDLITTQIDYLMLLELTDTAASVDVVKKRRQVLTRLRRRMVAVDKKIARYEAKQIKLRPDHIYNIVKLLCEYLGHIPESEPPKIQQTDLL